MIRFKQYILGAFDNPYKWKEFHDGYGAYYQFTSKKNDLYTIGVNKDDDLNVVEIKFWMGDEDEVKIGDQIQSEVLTLKNVIRVLSTVGKIVETIITNDRPKKIDISGTSPKRTSLYMKMIKKSVLIQKTYEVKKYGSNLYLILRPNHG